MKKDYSIDDLCEIIRKPQAGRKEDDILDKFMSFQSISQLGTFFYAFIDLSKMEYLYVSPSIKMVLGYTADELIKGGVKSVFNVYHPDVKQTQKAVHNKVINFLRSVPVGSKTKYVYTYDLTIKNKKGEYIKLLQINRCIKLDKSGLPLFIFLMCIDITNFKTDPHQVLVISKMTKNGLKKVVEEEYYPEYENGILTKKETEVWRLIKLGFSAKEISLQLGISFHTVNTHRKNIYRKFKVNS